MSCGGETPSTALVVEDDGLTRMHAVQIVEAAGFKCLDAPNADAAITLLEANAGRISLLFTDVEMPGSMNGFDLARQTARRWPHVGILVASGRRRPTPEDLPEGATFIRKPFSAEVVHESLKSLFPAGRLPGAVRS